MPFVSVRFDARADLAERWSDALVDAGALAVDVSDPAAGTADERPLYGEPGDDGTPLWQESRIDALFAHGTDIERVLAETSAAIESALPPYKTRTVADQDWVRATQSQFGPIAIGEGFWIVPSWCEPPEPGAIVLRLDPGLAFGTGSHPTTRLCLEWMRESLVRGDRVLDYGCGSGILAIAAAKLGGREVTGTDVDSQALAASVANARANGVEATFVSPEALVARGNDVVVANILAQPLVLLAPALAARTRIGGSIALSGILDAQAIEVAAAYARWFTLAVWRGLDGWALLAGVRHDRPRGRDFHRDA